MNKREESLKTLALNQFLDKVKGIEYSSSLNVNYDGNRLSYKCVAQQEMLPKSFAFILNPRKGVCLNRIFDRIDELDNIIKTQINRESNILSGLNLNLVKHLRTDLLFSYAINFFYTNSFLNKKLKYQVTRLNTVEREVLENLPNDYVNILSFDHSDLDLISRHLNYDTSKILLAKESLLRIVDNIETELKKTTNYEYFDKWATGNGVKDNILYFLSSVWSKAIYLDENVSDIVFSEFKESLKNNKIDLDLSDGIPCLFTSLSFCNYPNEIKSSEEESSYILRTSVMNKKLVIHSNHHIEEGKEFSYLFNSDQLTSLDYLLQYGWSIDNFYNSFYRIKINNDLTFDLYMNNFEELEKFFLKLNPNKAGESLYVLIINQLQADLDIENKTDDKLFFILNELSGELSKLPKDKNEVKKVLKKKMKIFEFIKNSRKAINSHLEHFVKKLENISKKVIGRNKNKLIRESE